MLHPPAAWQGLAASAVIQGGAPPAPADVEHLRHLWLRLASRSLCWAEPGRWGVVLAGLLFGALQGRRYRDAGGDLPAGAGRHHRGHPGTNRPVRCRAAADPGPSSGSVRARETGDGSGERRGGTDDRDPTAPVRPRRPVTSQPQVPWPRRSFVPCSALARHPPVRAVRAQAATPRSRWPCRVRRCTCRASTSRPPRPAYVLGARVAAHRRSPARPSTSRAGGQAAAASAPCCCSSSSRCCAGPTRAAGQRHPGQRGQPAAEHADRLDPADPRRAGRLHGRAVRRDQHRDRGPAAARRVHRAPWSPAPSACCGSA